MLWKYSMIIWDLKHQNVKYYIHSISHIVFAHGWSMNTGYTMVWCQLTKLLGSSHLINTKYLLNPTNDSSTMYRAWTSYKIGMGTFLDAIVGEGLIMTPNFYTTSLNHWKVDSWQCSYVLPYLPSLMWLYLAALQSLMGYPWNHKMHLIMDHLLTKYWRPPLWYNLDVVLDILFKMSFSLLGHPPPMMVLMMWM